MPFFWGAIDLIECGGVQAVTGCVRSSEARERAVPYRFLLPDMAVAGRN